MRSKLSTAKYSLTSALSRTSALRALKHRNFQLFFSGQLISLIGTWMQSVAQSWLVYRLTNSATLLGFVGFCSQIPVLLLAPIGGALADRLDKRKVLIFTQTSAMILAFILSALTLTGSIKTWYIFLIAAMLGIINAFDIPTRQSFIVEMVGKDDLMNAIALNSSMFNGARIVGPAIAGFLVSTIGEGWCFFANGVSYIAVIAGLIMMRTNTRNLTTARRENALSEITEGFRYAISTTPVRALLLLLGLVSLMGMPYAVLMPIIADQILHRGARGLGILMGAAGLGALIGALSLAMRKELRGLGRWIMIASLSFGISLILFALSRSFWLSVVLLIPVGFSMMVQMAASNTLIQTMTPDNLRGRVMAIYSMMFMGLAPFGSLLAGTLANHLGAPETIVIGGICCIVGAVIFGYQLPALREEAREIILELHMTGGEPAEEISTVAKS